MAGRKGRSGRRPSGRPRMEVVAGRVPPEVALRWRRYIERARSAGWSPGQALAAALEAYLDAQEGAERRRAG